MLVRDAIAELRTMRPDDHILMAVWVAADVIGVAKDNGKLLTEELAGKILNLIDRRHNAEEGVNWTVIKLAIELYEEINDITLPKCEFDEDKGGQKVAIKELMAQFAAKQENDGSYPEYEIDPIVYDQTDELGTFGV